MKRVQVRRRLTGIIIHVRRDMWGRGVLPSKAYQGFKHMRENGWFAQNMTWQKRCEHYRKRIRKNQIAKESRRRNRRK